MSHVNELVQRLLPLGVYTFRQGSYSLGELEALGGALDILDTWAQEGQRESIVMTAAEEGLSKMEALFRHKGAARTVEARRAAIAGFLQISGDSFTLEALNRCLRACGIRCLVEETGEVNRVKVSFPGIMGIPEGYEQMKPVIDDILPCHLDVWIYFRYCTWAETEGYKLRWRHLNTMTWHEWEVYREPTVVA